MPNTSQGQSLPDLIARTETLQIRMYVLVSLMANSRMSDGPCMRDCLEMALEYCQEHAESLAEYSKRRKLAGKAQTYEEQEILAANVKTRTFIRMSLDAMDEDGHTSEDVSVPSLMEMADNETCEAPPRLPDFDMEDAGGETHAAAPDMEAKEFSGIAKLVDDYVLAIGPFFDLAAEEFRKHNNTDFDGLEFLFNAVKGRHRDFARDAWAVYGESKEAAQ